MNRIYRINRMKNGNVSGRSTILLPALLITILFIL